MLVEKAASLWHLVIVVQTDQNTSIGSLIYHCSHLAAWSVTLKATYMDGWKDIKFLIRITVLILNYETPEFYMKNKSLLF